MAIVQDPLSGGVLARTCNIDIAVSCGRFCHVLPYNICRGQARELGLATAGFMGGDLQSQGEETFLIPIDIALDERFELFPCRHRRAPPLRCRIETRQSYRLCYHACIMPSKHTDRNGCMGDSRAIQRKMDSNRKT